MYDSIFNQSGGDSMNVITQQEQKRQSGAGH